MTGRIINVITFTVFEPHDLLAIDAQAAQRELAGDRIRLARTLAAGGRCFTVRNAAGRVVMCAGAVETHGDYATLWAAIGREAGPVMLPITRRVRQFAAMLPHRRIDAQVRPSHDAAVRWMGMLNFRLEAVIADVFEDGEAAMVFRYERGTA